MNHILITLIPIWMYIIKMTDMDNIGKFTLFILLNCTINMTAKNILKHPRPTNEVMKFDNYGMPSGHAQAVWFIVFYQYKNVSIQMSGLLILLAIISCIQRIVTRKHTIGQVIVGSIVGSSLGMLASNM